MAQGKSVRMKLAMAVVHLSWRCSLVCIFLKSGLLNLKKAGAAGFEYSYSVLSLWS